MDFRDIINTIDRIEARQILLEQDQDISGEYWYIPGFDSPSSQKTAARPVPQREQEIAKTIQELNTIYDQLKQLVSTSKLNEDIGDNNIVQMLKSAFDEYIKPVGDILLEIPKIKDLVEKDLPPAEKHRLIAEIIGRLVTSYGVFWVAATLSTALLGGLTGPFAVLVGIASGTMASLYFEEDTDRMADQIIAALMPTGQKPQIKLAPGGTEDIAELQLAFQKEGFKNQDGSPIVVNGLLDANTIKIIQQDLNKRGASITINGTIDEQTAKAISKYYLNDEPIKETFQSQLQLLESELLNEANVVFSELVKKAAQKLLSRFQRTPAAAGAATAGVEAVVRATAPSIFRKLISSNPAVKSKLKKALVGGAVIGGGIAYQDELGTALSQLGDTPREKLAKQIDSTSAKSEPVATPPTGDAKPKSTISPEIRGLVATADQALARAAEYKDNRVRNDMERLDMFIDSIPGMRAIRKPAAWLN